MSVHDSNEHDIWASGNETKSPWGANESNEANHKTTTTALNQNSNVSSTLNSLTIDNENPGHSIFGSSSPVGSETNIFKDSLDEQQQENDSEEQGVWGGSNKSAKFPPFSDPLTATLNIFDDNITRGEGSSEVNNIETEQQTNNEELEEWIKAARKRYNPLLSDIVSIEEIPEREGLLFKHINYKLVLSIELPDTEPSDSKSVVRRYSDFDWLQEVLLKRYPFRMIPELPPKKIKTSQNLDPTFLKKRQHGLYTFINLIMKHPILKEDDLVLTFLTVPTDLSTWRKQLNNKFDTVDEFHNKRITKTFIKMWKPELSIHLNDVAGSIDRTIETWNKVNIIVQRSQRRLQQKIHENKIMTNLLNDLQGETSKMYPIDIDEGNNRTVLDINNNLSIINKHISDLNILNDEEIAKLSQELIPKFAIYIDILVSLKNMFERYRIMATNNIPQLQRHIEIDMERLESMKGKPDSSGTEYDRLRLSVKKDRASIVQQLNRSWLIRQCIFFEFAIFQETQFLISNAFKDWTRLNSSTTELNMNAWEKVTGLIENMALSNNL
ncbi:similar to Saccharomyces cerevisiae YMR004W MVP1 Protein required for sorting proteins to the vacuole [Maudiozyma barnettii]|uniref:Sorting nexin MVP1 n=1 Tax=Maudiozyma barnettii TaxID=61262 RepID=A0A8H2VFH0_9SACH|nr:Mvp1p [Kazachstania barnettii]CAB4254189.1 similar to Saccharomyces cerevisiae YMR004W MVP1 Protein required for sorting proteins to the vacuole [Kazachstania barnettii]CAD1781923.1 similar to Saccharomyces cerevisiae YMR004W MVP1 Protein required for sorting proteins to the vacuole [Kazachstania barnettii]